MNQKGNTPINIIIIIIITALVVGGAVYYYQNQKMEPCPQPEQLNQETFASPMLERDQYVYFDGKVKKYIDKKHHFSLTIPTTYIYDVIRGMNGLWSAANYEGSRYPLVDQMVIPDIGIRAEKLNNQTLEQFILEDQDAIGMTLEDFGDLFGDLYEKTQLGDNEFIILNVSEYLDNTFYYTQHEDVVVSFITHWFEDEEDERYKDIIQIISTLQFQ